LRYVEFRVAEGGVRVAARVRVRNIMYDTGYGVLEGLGKGRQIVRRPSEVKLGKLKTAENVVVSSPAN
jgi:hypothetical protein